MKKFYLKIYILTFMVVLIAIPAAAKSHLTSLIKLEDFKITKSKGRFLNPAITVTENTVRAISSLKFYLKSARRVICAHVLHRVSFYYHYAE